MEKIVVVSAVKKYVLKNYSDGIGRFYDTYTDTS